MELLGRLKNYDIILASASPRRRELLLQAGLPFRVLVRPVPEHFTEGMDPVDVVHHLCREKAGMFEKELMNKNTIVITADTIVVNAGLILNKPSGPDQAYAMLRQLSGTWHEVHTGVCLRGDKQELVFHETTRVFFRELSDEEIWHYVIEYKPFDKAGSYGIQEWIGHVGISGIEGSYSNVVGLPVHRVYEGLAQLVTLMEQDTPPV